MHERKIDKFRPLISFSIYAFVLVLFFLFSRYLLMLAWGLAYLLPSFRYALGNLDLLISSLIVNTVNCFRYKQYNMPDNFIGTIDCYVADSRKVFGCCKTLSAVKQARYLYQRFDGVSAYDYKCQNPHWVTWQVRVISNVDIVGVPTIPFRSLNQLVELSSEDCDGIFTVVVMDECNAIMNSRNFKSNFQNEDQIKSIVTCRHNNIHMMLVGQRFEYLDKLIRSLADRVIMCRHYSIFNTVRHKVFIAAELDKAINPDLVKCVSTRYRYLFRSDYDSYDTKALVESVAHDDSVSSVELVALKGDTSSDLVGGRSLSAKGKKLRKKVL